MIESVSIYRIIDATTLSVKLSKERMKKEKIKITRTSCL